MHPPTLNLSLSLSATVFNNANQQINVYGDDVEVDYRGYEVTSLSLSLSLVIELQGIVTL